MSTPRNQLAVRLDNISTTTPAALAAEPVLATGVLVARDSNTADVVVSIGGVDVSLWPGSAWPMSRVDLSLVTVLAAAGGQSVLFAGFGG